VHRYFGNAVHIDEIRFWILLNPVHQHPGLQGFSPEDDIAEL
jgi:hypothetical protein